VRLNYVAHRFVFFMAGIITTLCGFVPPCPAESENPVVATVNEIPIKKSQVDSLVPTYRKEAGKIKLDDEDKKKILQNLIRRQLILQQKVVQDLRGDEDIIKRVRNYEDDLVVKAFLEKEIGTKLKVSEEELKKYYKENIREFSSPPKVKARHILLRNQEEAEKVLSRLRGGEDFGQLAKDFSIDLPNALEGGSLGVIKKGEALPELDKALFSLKEGDFSNIVKTEYGYHILTIDKKITINFKPFEEVKDQIRKTILQQKEVEAYNEMADELEKDADIKIFEDRLHQASD
jgi:parvulin-like peptidyl-prolyl isomerase